MGRAVLLILSLGASGIAVAQTGFDLELVPQVGHVSEIYSIDVSPDGALLVSAAADNVVILWDTLEGHVIRRFEGHEDEVTAVKFSPATGGLITASVDGTMRVWDVRSGDHRSRVEAPSPSLARLFGDQDVGRFHALDVTADGRVVAGYSTGARVYELRSGIRSKAFGHLLYPVYDIAVSADGRLFAAAQDTATTFIYDEAGKKTKLKGHRATVRAVAVSRDGRYVTSGAEDGQVLLWEPGESSQGRSICSHHDVILSIAFSPDGSMLASGSEDGSLSLCDVTSGELIRPLKTVGPVDSLVFHPDGSRLSAACYSALLTWDLNPPDLPAGTPSPSEADLAERLRRLPSQLHGGVDTVIDSPFMGDISRDRRLACTSYYRNVVIWEVASGRTIARIPEEREEIFSDCDFDSQGDRLATGTAGGHLAVYDIKSGQPLASTTFSSSGINAVEWALDDSAVVAGSKDNLFGRWNPDGAENDPPQEYPDPVRAMAMSPNEKLFAFNSGYKVLFFDMTDVNKHKESNKPTAVVRAIAFDAREEYAATGGEWGELLLWSLPSYRRRELKGHEETINAVDFSPDGRYLVTASQDRTLRLWNVETGTTERVLTGHTENVNSAFFVADGRSIWSGSSDGTMRLWDVATGREVGRLFRFVDGTEVAVDLHGRFDAQNLDDLGSLGWILGDAPLQLLPIEIFLRDYYEPRLLERLVAGEQLPPVDDLRGLNRVQPRVEIQSVTADATDKSRISVVVRVESRKERQGQRGVLESEVYNLRLFRDGVLVRYRDGPIAVSQDGSAELTFPGIRVPKRRGGQIELSAYAFNVDRVKSRTARYSYELKSTPSPDELDEPKVYLVSVGVTTTTDPFWSLDFAAKDAEVVRTHLAAALRDHGRIVPIVLTGSPKSRLSPFGHPDAECDTIVPTKANVQTVLDLLSGHKVAPALEAQLPDKTRACLAPVQPEDLLVVSISAHGVTRGGEFYLLPYDVGSGSRGRVDDTLLEHAISSDDLSDWMRDVDADLSVLIIDTCYAQAAVDRAGFKPAPLGNRGLGQLSYDKGMPVLVAAQTDVAAWEALGTSLLTQALAIDGLARRRAPSPDGNLTLTDVLAYAAERVPQLFAQHGIAATAQRPWFFDFRKVKRRVSLAPIESPATAAVSPTSLRSSLASRATSGRTGRKRNPTTSSGIRGRSGLGLGIASALDGGTSLSPEELDASGFNTSAVHFDVPFGSAEVDVVATECRQGEVVLLERGRWTEPFIDPVFCPNGA